MKCTEIATIKLGFNILNHHLLPVGREKLLISDENGFLYPHKCWTEIITVEAQALQFLISENGFEET